jgi:hypothetical protein
MIAAVATLIAALVSAAALFIPESAPQDGSRNCTALGEGGCRPAAGVQIDFNPAGAMSLEECQCLQAQSCTGIEWNERSRFREVHFTRVIRLSAGGSGDAVCYVRTSG